MKKSSQEKRVRLRTRHCSTYIMYRAIGQINELEYASEFPFVSEWPLAL